MTPSSTHHLTAAFNELKDEAVALKTRIIMAITENDVNWAKDRLAAVKEAIAEIAEDLGLEPEPEEPEEAPAAEEPVTK